MTKSLRERQKEIARDAILDAMAVELAETGSLDFSMADIANRAGVSHRTVYNYFGSRQELIDAFSEWTDDTIHAKGGVIVPHDLEDLPAAVVTNFHIFEDQSAIAEVLARMDTAERATAAHRRRDEAFENAVSAAYPQMDIPTRRVIAVLMRQIASVRSWYFMTREHGVSTDDAAVASAWALRRLIAALDSGSLPKLNSRH